MVDVDVGLGEGGKVGVSVAGGDVSVTSGLNVDATIDSG
jgi:hypothetical protein